jgi:hypothetical protein
MVSSNSTVYTDNGYWSFSAKSIGIPGQFHIRTVGKLHAIGEVTVGGAVWKSAWRGRAVRGMVGSRVVGAARGPLRVVGIWSRARASRATDSFAAARVRASRYGRVRGGAGSGLCLLARIRVGILLLGPSRPVRCICHHVVSWGLSAKQTGHSAVSFAKRHSICVLPNHIKFLILYFSILLHCIVQ